MEGVAMVATAAAMVMALGIDPVAAMAVGCLPLWPEDMVEAMAAAMEALMAAAVAGVPMVWEWATELVMVVAPCTAHLAVMAEEAMPTAVMVAAADMAAAGMAVAGTVVIIRTGDDRNPRRGEDLYCYSKTTVPLR